MEPPKAYEPKQVEDKIYELWEKSGFFNPDKLPKRHKKPYTIVIPPPNVTGELHMGHALNATVQDILIRWKRMQGFKTLWLPGTDHAGIATQNVVEKKLRKEEKTRFDLGREKFIEQVWEWKEKYGNIILNQFKKIGSSCDWSRTRFTMDNDYAEAVKKAFLHYYEKGWIYKGKRVVNWCPRCQTSLSDLELEYKEEKGNLWFIKYPLKNDHNFIIVATTRPETMLGDTAIAVNPKDKRYKEIIGQKALLPLIEKELPIIADVLVDENFGTGALKVTPAHDTIDYEMGLRHNLEIVQVIDERGRMINVPENYKGLNTNQAREKVVFDLTAKGLLEKTEEYIHQVPKCYRCNATVELIPSKQWFLKMRELAKTAEEQVKKGKIKFHPKSFEKPYFEWLKNVKDWCISRQIWWGHKIPIEGENDVLDTWFSAALWPFATLGWPARNASPASNTSRSDADWHNDAGGPADESQKTDFKKYYPTDVLVTARDIINLWVARMIFSGMEFMGKIPFKDIYINATVLTRDGQRMSKSLGTGINPINLIDAYGADATRFGIAYQIMGGQDIKFVEDNILMGKKFCNKIWNASRFVLGQIPAAELKTKSIKLPVKFKNFTPADKKILKALDKTIKSINNDLNKFAFGKAAHVLYNFFWHDFCDKYIENFKVQISNLKSQDKRKKSQEVILYVLLTSLKLLHPFIPFITEKIYQELPLKNKKKCLMIEDWPIS